MKSFKMTIKVLIILIIVVFMVLILYKNRIILISLYQNYNLNHVNLKKGGWEKLFEFVTVKNSVPVEIYGRKGNRENSGEFVVVRYGLLPFNFKLISPIDSDFNVWRKELKKDQTVELTFLCRIGYFSNLYNRSKHTFTPGIVLVLDYFPFGNVLRYHSIQYTNCDNLSKTINLPNSIDLEKEKIFNTPKTYWVNKSLPSIFSTKEFQ